MEFIKNFLQDVPSWVVIGAALLVVFLPDGFFKNILTKVLDKVPLTKKTNTTTADTTDQPVLTFIKLIEQLRNRGEDELADELAKKSPEVLKCRARKKANDGETS